MFACSKSSSAKPPIPCYDTAAQRIRSAPSGNRHDYGNDLHKERILTLSSNSGIIPDNSGIVIGI